jgi:hypothetical protein
VFVFGENGGEALRKKDNPERLLLHKGLESAGVEFIDENGAAPGAQFARDEKAKRLKHQT